MDEVFFWGGEGGGGSLSPTPMILNMTFPFGLKFGMIVQKIVCPLKQYSFDNFGGFDVLAPFQSALPKILCLNELIFS